MEIVVFAARVMRRWIPRRNRGALGTECRVVHTEVAL
jgi:hypothetical protein